MGPLVGAAIIGGVAQLAGALIGRGSAGDAADTANQQVTDQLEYQRKQDALLEVERQRYREFEFTNPYANLQNPFEGMENAYEDGGCISIRVQ